MQHESGSLRSGASPGARPHLKPLPLGEVERMCRQGEADGWYVAEHDARWTVGLQSRGQHYVVMLGAEPMTFGSMKVAVKYLRALCVPTGVERATVAPSNLTRAFADALSQIESGSLLVGSRRG